MVGLPTTTNGARLPFRIPPPPRGMPKHVRVWYWTIASMVLASLAVVPMCPTQDAAGRPTWRVRTVHDGDTVTCIDATGAPQKIRLVGIDAPEFDQPYGRASRAALEGKIGNRLVRVTGTARDRYGRLLGTLWIDTRNINRELVSEGEAWEFGGFSPDRDLVEQELNAREARRGLWADPEPMSPTQWRNTHRHHVHPENGSLKGASVIPQSDTSPPLLCAAIARERNRILFRCDWLV